MCNNNYTVTKEDLSCDKCGRPIPSGKGYININGWIICGICQYEDQVRQFPPISPQSEEEDKYSKWPIIPQK